MQPDLLSQLQDIQTPAQVGNWPLAWGWWAVIVLSFFIFVLIAISVYRFIKQRKAKKQALKLLNQVDPEQNPIIAVQTINSILKRVVLAYSERDLVANLNGEKWTVWLNTHGHKNAQINSEFVQLAYQENCSSEQASEYLKQSKNWINKSLPLSKQALKSVSQGEQNV